MAQDGDEESVRDTYETSSLSEPLVQVRPTSLLSWASRGTTLSSLNVNRIVDDSMIGMAVAVSWSYVLVQQLDATSDCPTVDDENRFRCWLLVVALFVNAVFGTFYFPAICMLIMRVTGRWCNKLQSASAAGVSRMSESRVNRRVRMWMRVQRLSTAAASTAWGVGATLAIYYLLAQLEAEATNGDVAPNLPGPFGPRTNGGGLVDLPDDVHEYHDDCEDPSPTPLPRHLLRHFHKRNGGDKMLGGLPPPPRSTGAVGGCTAEALGNYLPKIAWPVLLIALFGCGFCLLVQSLASRRLGRPASPYVTELMLLLSRSLQCCFATAFMAGPSLLLFPCYELGLGDDTTMLALAAMRAVFFFASGFMIARYLSKGRDSHDDDALINVLASDWKKCVTYLLIGGSGVFACIGVHDFISTLISSDFLDASDTLQLIIWFSYAIILVIAAAVREACSSEDDGEHHARSGGRFYSTFESWLVAFAFWVPVETLLIELYDALPESVSGAYVEGGGLSDVKAHLLRLVWQVLLALLFTLTLSALSLILRPQH